MRKAFLSVAMGIGLASCVTGCADEEPKAAVVVLYGFDEDGRAIESSELVRALAVSLDVEIVESPNEEKLTEQIASASSVYDTIGVVAVGHGGSAAWAVVAKRADVVDTAAFIGVPGVANLDVSGMTRTPVLNIHAEADQLVANSHETVHAALAITEVPHEMVVYDEVMPTFFDDRSIDWSEECWRDAVERTVEFIDVAIHSDELLEVH